MSRLLRLFVGPAAAVVGRTGCGALRSLLPSAEALTIVLPGVGSQAPELDGGPAAVDRTSARRPRL